MFVRQKSQQLAGEATVPYSIISSCQIDKRGTSLLFCLKRILNVLRKQNDLIYGRLSMSKSSLFLWKQRVDYWFDAIVYQSFEDLVRGTEKRDGMVTLWILYSSVSNSRPSEPFNAARETILKFLINFGSIATFHLRKNV